MSLRSSPLGHDVLPAPSMQPHPRWHWVLEVPRQHDNGNALRGTDRAQHMPANCRQLPEATHV